MKSKPRQRLCIAAALFGLAALCPAQVTLTADPPPGSSHSPGLMLDVIADQPLLITSVDVHVAIGSSSGGSCEILKLNANASALGHETTPADWTAIASVTIPSGFTGPLSVPLVAPVFLGADSRVGLYLRLSGGPELALSPGNQLNAPFARDMCLTLTQGTPMPASFTPSALVARLVGAFGYLPFAPCPGFPYQRNQPEASLDINGVQSDGRDPAITGSCPAGSAFLHIDSNLPGALWEMAIVAGPVIPNALILPPPFDQVVNVDLGSPSLIYLWSGNSSPNPQTIGSSGLALTFPLPTSTSLIASAQMIVISPTGPGGLALKISQAPQYQVQFGGISLLGPFADDDLYSISLANAPNCVSAIPFYAGSYTIIGVSSNGRVLLSNTPISSTLSSPSPSIAALAADPPFAGLWTDLMPNYNGTAKITTTFLATGIVDVTYQAIPYWANPMSCAPTATMSFSIQFNNVNGSVSLSGLGSLGAYTCANYSKFGAGPLAPNQLLGISPGPVGGAFATNLPFGSGSNGTVAPNQARVHLNNSTSTVNPGGLASLTFARNPPNPMLPFVSYSVTGF